MVHGCTMTSFGYFSVKKTVYNIIDWLTKCPAKRRRKIFLAIFGRLYLPKTKFCSLLFKKKYPRPPFKSTHQGIDLGQSCIAKCWSAKIELSVQWVVEYEWRASIVTLGYKATRGSTDKSEWGDRIIRLLYTWCGSTFLPGGLILALSEPGNTLHELPVPGVTHAHENFFKVLQIFKVHQGSAFQFPSVKGHSVKKILQAFWKIPTVKDSVMAEII